MRTPRFIYFDLGNVLLTFDVTSICRRVAELAGIEPRRVREAVFENGLQTRYELGAITTRDYYEAFCRATGSSPGCDALHGAVCDAFHLRPDIVPLIVGLRRQGHRLGILSNTCEAHWDGFLQRHPILHEHFEVHALSYRLRAAKPDAAIFHAAAQMAAVPPGEVFFTDDVAGHVEGARRAGFDAVQFVSTAQLIEDLRHRGVRIAREGSAGR